MSLDLNHSPGYINKIASGRISPSMREFLYICEYLEITPDEFFLDYRKASPEAYRVIKIFDTLDDSDQKLVLDLLNRLKKDS